MEDNTNVDELKTVQRELLKCQKSKNSVETEYYKCEKELKIKTAEVEKLKIELKDLKEIITLSEELNL